MIHHRNMILIHIFLVLALFSSVGWSWKDLFSNRAEKALKLYEEGKVEEALKLYSEEATQNPDSPEVSYNLGNMLYRNGRFQESIPPYKKAGKQRNLEQMAKFNSGNSLFRLGMSSGKMKKLEMALDSYREAIQLDPDDLDAKYNYEFVKKMLDQIKNQQSESSQSDSSSSEGEKQEKGRDQQESKEGEKSPNEETKEQKQGEQPEKARDKNKAGAEDEERRETADTRAEPKREGEINKEDARRMLEALMGKEKDQLAERFKTMGEGRINVERDW